MYGCQTFCVLCYYYDIEKVNKNKVNIEWKVHQPKGHAPEHRPKERPHPSAASDPAPRTSPTRGEVNGFRCKSGRHFRPLKSVAPGTTVTMTHRQHCVYYWCTLMAQRTNTHTTKTQRQTYINATPETCTARR